MTGPPKELREELMMTEGGKKTLQMLEIVELDKEIRGPLMIILVEIEHSIGDIISNYFCNDNKKQLIFKKEILSKGRISDKMQIDLLQYILKNQFLDIYNEHKSSMKKLNKIRIFRNNIIHRSPDIGSVFKSDYNEKTLYLTHGSSDESDPFIITYDEGLAKQDELTGVWFDLRNIRTVIATRLSTGK